MSRYECSGCGKMSCEGECFHECAPGEEIDAEVFARQAKLAKEFFERRNAELMALRDADGSLGDPMKDCEPRKAA